jgi:hypothetical protein
MIQKKTLQVRNEVAHGTAHDDSADLAVLPELPELSPTDSGNSRRLSQAHRQRRQQLALLLIRVTRHHSSDRISYDRKPQLRLYKT